MHADGRQKRTHLAPLYHIKCIVRITILLVKEASPFFGGNNAPFIVGVYSLFLLFFQNIDMTYDDEDFTTLSCSHFLAHACSVSTFNDSYSLWWWQVLCLLATSPKKHSSLSVLRIRTMSSLDEYLYGSMYIADIIMMLNLRMKLFCFVLEKITSFMCKHLGSILLFNLGKLIRQKWIHMKQKNEPFV